MRNATLAMLPMRRENFLVNAWGLRGWLSSF